MSRGGSLLPRSSSSSLIGSLLLHSDHVHGASAPTPCQRFINNPEWKNPATKGIQGSLVDFWCKNGLRGPLDGFVIDPNSFTEVIPDPGGCVADGWIIVPSWSSCPGSLVD